MLKIEVTQNFYQRGGIYLIEVNQQHELQALT